MTGANALDSWLDAAFTHALHGVAWVALRVQPPAKATRTVALIGSRLRPFAGIEDARTAVRSLAKSGSCLSRSLAIAARLPGSRVVIGVDPRWSNRLQAHAWVELGSETVDGAGGVARGEVIARL